MLICADWLIVSADLPPIHLGAIRVIGDVVDAVGEARGVTP